MEQKIKNKDFKQILKKKIEVTKAKEELHPFKVSADKVIIPTMKNRLAELFEKAKIDGKINPTIERKRQIADIMNKLKDRRKLK